MKSFAKTTGLLGVSACALIAPMMVQAQTAPAAEPTTAKSADPTSEEVIVYARRRDESIQDVPAVVNAVTSEEIAKLNFRQFQEVQTVVPGLNLNSVANGTGGGATLRGVNFDINASGNNPSVEFYQNDAPITAGVVLQEMYDIGQIEVLRGPQGTLRGRASPSGSITVTTRKPDMYRPGGYGNVTVTDTGGVNVNGAVSLPLLPGIAAIRVAGVTTKDAFDRIKSIKTFDGRPSGADTKSIRVTGIVDPIDALHFEGSWERYDRHFRSYDQVESFSLLSPGAPASPVLIRPEDRLSNQEAPRVVRQKYDIFNGRAELRAFGQKLIYQFQHYNQNIDSYGSQDTAEVLPNFDFGQTTTSRIRSESHELRLQNEERVLGIFDYVIGAFANTNDVPTNLIVRTPVYLPAAFGGGLATVNISNIARLGHSNEKSLFGNVTAHIGDTTQLSGGVRYITYKANGSLIIPGTGGSITIPDAPVDLKHVIYSASIQHNFTPGIMVYASTGTSFRPGVDAVGDFSTAQSALERSFLHLAPESSQSYEVGIKTSMFDNRMHVNVSGYHQTFKNYPYRTAGTGVYYVNTSTTLVNNVPTAVQSVSLFNFVSAVPVEVNGVEAEVGYDFSKRIKVNLVAAYALGKINNGTVPCNDLNKDGVPDTVTTAPTVAQLQAAYGANNVGACKVSQRAAFQSPFSASATAEYGVPLSAGVDGYVRGLVSFNGQSQGDPTNPFDNAGAYALANIYLGVRDPKGAWELNLFAKNVFNEVKVLSLGANGPNTTTVQVLKPDFSGANGMTTAGTYTSINTTAPREFGVNLRFAFGSR